MKIRVKYKVERGKKIISVQKEKLKIITTTIFFTTTDDHGRCRHVEWQVQLHCNNT